MTARSALRPDYAEALNNRGVTLQELKRFEEALASYDRALGAAAGLCRGAQQSWRHPAGAEAVRRRRWRATTARSPCGRTMPRRIGMRRC